MVCKYDHLNTKIFTCVLEKNDWQPSTIKAWYDDFSSLAGPIKGIHVFNSRRPLICNPNGSMVQFVSELINRKTLSSS